jgi:hypothetical protein
MPTPVRKPTRTVRDRERLMVSTASSRRVGRTHARTRVLLLVHDLDIRVINAVTSELLLQLVLDPTRNYQPTGRPDPRPEHPANATTPNSDHGFGVSSMSSKITNGGAEGI